MTTPTPQPTNRSNKAKLVAAIGAAATASVLTVVTYFEGTIFKTYHDPIGIVTSCTGHTGPELQMGQQFTPEQCNEQLYGDLLKHNKDLACVTKPLTANQTAALLSFSFNVGGKSFCNSTLVHKFNAGDSAGGCKELLRWTRAGGVVLPGLVTRRQAEYNLCIKP